MNQSFSKRHGFEQIFEAEISVRNEAPNDFRGVLVNIAYEAGFTPKTLRPIVCAVLRERADESNWSEYPNIDEEIRRLVDGCEWYKIYDLVEKISNIQKTKYGAPISFESELESYFIEKGFGWKFVNHQLEVRGTAVFENSVRTVGIDLKNAGLNTAAAEFKEAIKDISRRPEADSTGAIQHAMAAVECVARHASGFSKKTLGDIIQTNRFLFPKPIDDALLKLWGYASENARHVYEGRKAEFEEAELVVGIAASVSTYLLRKKAV
jgi:AbiJ N-terminal domain 4